MHARRFTAALLLACAGAAPPASGYLLADGSFRVVGYNDMDQMLEAAARDAAASGSPFRYRFELKSTRSAPGALTDGSSVLAPMGAPMEPAELRAFRAAWGTEPVVFRIAHDSLTPGTLSSPTAVLVARSNPLRRIAMSQVRCIFTAACAKSLTRWSDLGVRGALGAMPIRPLTLAADTAIGRFLLEGQLAASGFSPRVITLRQSRDVAAKVADDATAIGLANANFAVNGLRALTLVDASGRATPATAAGVRSGRYPLDRFLLIYARRETNGRISPAAASLLGELLSDRGQAAIARQSRGYLPLNPAELRAERAILKQN